MNFKSILDFEKKSVFLINFFLVVLMIFIFYFNLKLDYFFYFNIILTLLVSYLFFRKSKKLSKTLILTNMFIFFYFLYPQVASFLSNLLGSSSYIFILFYTILISYLFLLFSGKHRIYLGDLKKFSFSILLVSFLCGLVFGLFFFLLNEPVPQFFVDIAQTGDIFDFFKFIVFSSFIVALSEQMIFSGFLFNSYRELTSKRDAFYQCSVMFVCFHLLRFEVLVKHYFVEFGSSYLFLISGYYVMLFLFMLFALYLYSFKAHGKEGNFIYPVFLHFGADLGLFLFYMLPLILV